MNPRSPGAFILSATFHAIVIGAACLFTLDSCQDKATPRVLELVAGEGDNFGATEAPKLGTPGGVKVDIPIPPEPKPPAPQAAPAPPPPEPQPAPPPVVTPAPTPKPPPKAPIKAPPKKDPDAIPNFSKQITRRVIRAESKAKLDIKKERDAEAKRLAKEEFDRRQREKIASAKAGSRVQHIDTEGIVKGVVGGSADNKVGGAGGKALQRDEGSLMEAYDSLLQQRVKAAIDKPPGVSDNLTVTISFTISASGHISNVRVETSSGSTTWDEAVVAAFHRVTMPPHPLHHSEDLELSFRTNDAGGD